MRSPHRGSGSFGRIDLAGHAAWVRCGRGRSSIRKSCRLCGSSRCHEGDLSKARIRHAAPRPLEQVASVNARDETREVLYARSPAKPAHGAGDFSHLSLVTNYRRELPSKASPIDDDSSPCPPRPARTRRKRMVTRDKPFETRHTCRTALAAESQKN